MNYISTRSKGTEKFSSAEAILQGFSPDGGLFVPESIPKIKIDDIEKLIPLTYEQRAVKILREFLTDYSDDELAECAEIAYDWFDA